MHILNVQKFNASIDYLLVAKSHGCFGTGLSEKEELQFIEFSKYKDLGNISMRFSALPTAVEGLILVLQVVFIYLFCKLYGFQFKRF